MTPLTSKNTPTLFMSYGLVDPAPKLHHHQVMLSGEDPAGRSAWVSHLESSLGMFQRCWTWAERKQRRPGGKEDGVHTPCYPACLERMPGPAHMPGTAIQPPFCWTSVLSLLSLLSCCWTDIRPGPRGSQATGAGLLPCRGTVTTKP